MEYNNELATTFLSRTASSNFLWICCLTVHYSYHKSYSPETPYKSIQVLNGSTNKIYEYAVNIFVCLFFLGV